MAEPMDNKDRDPVESGGDMAGDVFRWVWPRKPMGKGKGPKGARGYGKANSKPRSTSRQPTKRNPFPGWT